MDVLQQGVSSGRSLNHKPICKIWKQITSTIPAAPRQGPMLPIKMLMERINAHANGASLDVSANVGSSEKVHCEFLDSDRNDSIAIAYPVDYGPSDLYVASWMTIRNAQF